MRSPLACLARSLVGRRARDASRFSRLGHSADTRVTRRPSTDVAHLTLRRPHPDGTGDESARREPERVCVCVLMSPSLC